jgi:hypothetical protein
MVSRLITYNGLYMVREARMQYIPCYVLGG